MRISKILTAALGVVALASCNNEDSFFNSAEQNFTSTLKVNVAPMVGEDGTQTRAGFYVVDGQNYTTWQDGDKVRVYDDNLAKYNTYTRTSGTFGTTGTQEASAYQLSPAGFVTYAGWKEGTGLTALVNIPAELTYDEFEKDDNNTAYISNIPLFGKVNSIEGGVLESSNVYLTGFLKVTLKNGYNMGNGIKSIKVTALKWNSTTWAEAGADKPLSGNFDAVLDPTDNFGSTEDTQKSKLQKGTETLVNYGYSSSILVNTSNLNIASEYESLVYIPIVPDTYDRIQIDLCSDANGTTKVMSYAMGKTNGTTGTAKTIKAGHWYANADFIDANGSGTFAATNDLNKKMEKSYDLTYTLAATTTTEINDYLSMLTSSKGSVTVNINSGNALTVETENTQPKMNTIYIPALQGAMTLNIGNNTNGMSIAHNDLTITDAAGVTDFTKPITINVTKFANEAAKKVIINTKRPITLAGDFSAVSTAPTITNAKTLTLGTETTPYTHPQNQIITIAADNATNLVVLNATDAATTPAKSMSVVYNGTGDVSVGSVATATIANTANSAKIIGAIGTSVTTAKDITVDAASTAEIAKLILEKTVSTVTVKGGIIDDIAETAIAANQYADNAAITLTSEGLSAVKKITAFTNNVNWNITSKFTVPATGTQYMDAFENLSTANIYTAAQLAAVANATGSNINGFKLKTNITELKNWQSPNLTKAFDGGKKLTNVAQNGLTIAGVDAPLFGIVTNNIDNVALTCAFPAASQANGVGGLAKTAGAANINVRNVTVAGDIYGSYNVGGIFGTTGANTVTVGANNKDVVIKAAFHNTTSYASPYNGRTDRAGTFGTIIGQAGTGAVTLTNNKVTDTDATFDKAALFFQYNRLPNADTGMNEWQFKGNTKFIGYSPTATSLTYGGQTYTSTWNTGTGAKKLTYNPTTKVVTGEAYIINSATAVGTSNAWYTSKDDAFITKMKSTFTTDPDLSGVAADANWDAVKVVVHNSWEAFAQ